MITAKINAVKIDKAHMFAGKNGAKYVDLVLFENRDGPDGYGNDGIVFQGVSKEAREAGVKGPIIGNWKRIEPRGGRRTEPPTERTSPAKAQPSLPVSGAPEEDDVPF